MRNALALVCGAFAITVACARNYNPDSELQPDPGTGYFATTTGAVLGPSDPNANGASQPEIGEVSQRMASQICSREARCHGVGAIEDQCLRLYSGLAATELSTWNCTPAAARARVKECLAAIDAEPCELDLSKRPRMCGPNAACPEVDLSVTPPAAAAETTPRP